MYSISQVLDFRGLKIQNFVFSILDQNLIRLVKEMTPQNLTNLLQSFVLILKNEFEDQNRLNKQINHFVDEISKRDFDESFEFHHLCQCGRALAKLKKLDEKKKKVLLNLKNRVEEIHEYCNLVVSLVLSGDFRVEELENLFHLNLSCQDLSTIASCVADLVE